MKDTQTNPFVFLDLNIGGAKGNQTFYLNCYYRIYL